MLLLALALVLIGVLYARTINFNNLIDDRVPMRDYLYKVPLQSPGVAFYLSKSPLRVRLWAIGVHCLNTWLVYLLLGGKAALLFAVFPVSVNNVAWITGSYYSTTTFLTLTSFYFLLNTPWWVGIPAAVTFFGVALNTTVAAISFPFVFLFGHPIGLVTLLSLAGFLTGKRFKVGLEIRRNMAHVVNALPDELTPRRLAIAVKVVAWYLYTALVPYRLCFFHRWGARFLSDPEERKDMLQFNKHFWASTALIVTWVVTGFVTGKLFWAMWFLVLISAFCQFKILGQFLAERYMYPAIVGVIAVFSTLPEPLYWMLVGAYLVRSFLFIGAFRNIKEMYLNGTRVEPTEAGNYLNLGDWYMVHEKDFTLAGHYLGQAVKHDPRDYRAHNNMGSVFSMMGLHDLAAKEIRIARKKAEGWTSDHFIKILERHLAQEERLAKEQAAVVENAQGQPACPV
jgi:hypothetical protein